MHTTMLCSAARSRAFLALLLLALGCKGALSVESDAHTAGEVAMAGLKKPVYQDRPLPIAGQSERIIEATQNGPVCRDSKLFTGGEDYHHPRLAELRRKYGLDKLLEGEKNQFRMQLKLRHWIRSQISVDNSQSFSGDAFAILEKAKDGVGFHCAHFTTVQHAVMWSCGFIARDLGVDRDWNDLGRSAHHGVSEVFSNDYAKWVMFDAKYDVHYELDGTPLSALEIHEAVRKNDGKGIVMVKGVSRRKVPVDDAESGKPTFRSYFWVSYQTRMNTFTQPNQRGGNKRVVFDNQYFQNDTWYRNKGGEKVRHWAYTGHFRKTRRRSDIEWTPGAVELSARQTGDGVLTISITSSTPNLKGYLVRFDKGNEQLVEDQFTWKLKKGRQTVRVCSVNLFGIEGPELTAAVRLR